MRGEKLIINYYKKIMSDNIFVIGHKSPDLDSVAAAIAYAELKNKSEATDKYIAAVAGEFNKETILVLRRLKIKKPQLISNAENLNLILVDHNEVLQGVDGLDKANILEIIDHHKIDYKSTTPIRVIIEPWGASCTVIQQLFKNKKLKPSKRTAGLMLAAILVDTVITKSPTCTDVDKIVIEELSKKAKINSWQEFGMEIFKERSNVSLLTVEQIVQSDYKDFITNSGKIGIGQVETVDLIDFQSREREIITELKKIKESGAYHSVILFITDIIKEGSLFLVATNDQNKLEQALGVKLENDRVYIPGIISRKKQVAPKIVEIF